MIRANTNPVWLPLYEALASSVRLSIIDLLAAKPMNVKQLAEELELSSAIVSMHIRKLEKAGIVETRMVRLNGGTHKICSLLEHSIAIDLPRERQEPVKQHEASIPVGHYTQFEVHPTCGIATSDKVIGQFDDPRFFNEPERMNASIIWFAKGYVEYKIPNYLLPGEQPTELEISLEIGSEAPGSNANWPSDISFTLNGIPIGMWTSPGDYGDRRGKFTPDWWMDSINQYGLLKVIRIQHNGTFIDGQKMSDVSIHDIGLDRNHWTFRLAVQEDAVHAGGLTIYGKGFGNYNQDMLFRVFYRSPEEGKR
ncbi:ArsR/SmtB family transcription factor [Paenibacillus protaetiae]|uniref:ArsR family transcriptional regulator n=1 Tax=Paenibacillus protaetiae TaxID=2509456 RepID=A0A4V0YEQ7_9BACL|nr:ArsR family transcriptional regulator [Paenibacillus protaetiae]QAY65051.1 ArsR family transcriptional regulator [Paenibacillus protaetiae]